MQIRDCCLIIALKKTLTTSSQAELPPDSPNWDPRSVSTVALWTFVCVSSHRGETIFLQRAQTVSKSVKYNSRSSIDRSNAEGFPLSASQFLPHHPSTPLIHPLFSIYRRNPFPMRTLGTEVLLSLVANGNLCQRCPHKGFARGVTALKRLIHTILEVSAE